MTLLLDMDVVERIIDDLEVVVPIDINDKVRLLKSTKDWENNEECVDYIRRLVAWEEERNEVQADIELFQDLMDKHITDCTKLSKVSNVSDLQAHAYIFEAFSAEEQGRKCSKNMMHHVGEKTLRSSLLCRNSAVNTFAMIIRKYTWLASFASPKLWVLAQRYRILEDKIDHFLFDF